MTVKPFRTNLLTRYALQLRVGETTKEDIQAFCPIANVGAWEDDSKRLAWVHVNKIFVQDRDWIVKLTHEEWIVMSPAVFSILFIPAGNDERQLKVD